MENEKRLIDANAVLAELDKFANPMPNKSGYDFLCGIATVITEIEDAPTIDAVEVVRCGECRFVDTDACPMSGTPGRVSASDFCSYGERRAENGNQA